jgi:hypothetical protein
MVRLDRTIGFPELVGRHGPARPDHRFPQTRSHRLFEAPARETNPVAFDFKARALLLYVRTEVAMHFNRMSNNPADERAVR